MVVGIALIASSLSFYRTKKAKEFFLRKAITRQLYGEPSRSSQKKSEYFRTNTSCTFEPNSWA